MSQAGVKQARTRCAHLEYLVGVQPFLVGAQPSYNNTIRSAISLPTLQGHRAQKLKSRPEFCIRAQHKTSTGYGGNFGKPMKKEWDAVACSCIFDHTIRSALFPGPHLQWAQQYRNIPECSNQVMKKQNVMRIGFTVVSHWSSPHENRTQMINMYSDISALKTNS